MYSNITKEAFDQKINELKARIAGQFIPPADYADAYNELREELKQCPVDAKKEP